MSTCWEDCIKVGRRGSASGSAYSDGVSAMSAYPPRAATRSGYFAADRCHHRRTARHGSAQFRPPTSNYFGRCRQTAFERESPSRAPRNSTPLHARTPSIRCAPWSRRACESGGGQPRNERDRVGAFRTPTWFCHQPAPSPISRWRDRRGHRPQAGLSTSGGTSDARFIASYCPGSSIRPGRPDHAPIATRRRFHLEKATKSIAACWTGILPELPLPRPALAPRHGRLSRPSRPRLSIV